MKLFSGDLGKHFRLLTKLVASYIATNKKLFLVVALVSFALLYFLPQIAPLIFHPKPLTIGYVGNYTPSTLPRFIQDEISFGLTRLTADDQASAGAALSWTATDSGKIILFDLNPNLTWQDGTKFTSGQLEYNLKGVDVSKPNDYQIKFSLKEPFAPLTNLLSQPIFKNGLMGLGENRVSSIKFNGRFLANIELKNIKTSQVTIYKFYPSEQMLLTAFKLGAVDRAVGFRLPLPTDLVQRYKVESKINGNLEAIIFFNIAKKPFDDKTIRQGLTYALPEEFAYGEVTDTPMPKNSWALSVAAKKYVQNKTLAEKFLEDISTKSAAFKIDLLVARGLEPVAQDIAKSWKDVGIETSVSVSDIVPQNFDAYLNYVDLPSDPDQYVLWHSTQNSNISGYKSPKVDKLLEEGRRTLDRSDRKDIYASFQKAITEDAPAAFLYYPKTYSISKR